MLKFILSNEAGRNYKPSMPFGDFCKNLEEALQYFSRAGRPKHTPQQESSDYEGPSVKLMDMVQDGANGTWFRN